jgi:hypothetical protein
LVIRKWRIPEKEAEVAEDTTYSSEKDPSRPIEVEFTNVYTPRCAVKDARVFAVTIDIL